MKESKLSRRGLDHFAGLAQPPENVTKILQEREQKKPKRERQENLVTVKISADSRDKLNAIKIFNGASMTATEAFDHMFETYYKTLDATEKRFMNRILKRDE